MPLHSGRLVQRQDPSKLRLLVSAGLDLPLLDHPGLLVTGNLVLVEGGLFVVLVGFGDILANAETFVVHRPEEDLGFGFMVAASFDTFFKKSNRLAVVLLDGRPVKVFHGLDEVVWGLLNELRVYIAIREALMDKFLDIPEKLLLVDLKRLLQSHRR